MPNVTKWLLTQGFAALCAASLVAGSAAADPMISRITPTEGPLNRVAVIHGSGFGHTQGTSIVELGDRQVPILFYSDAVIVIVAIPRVFDAPLALDTTYPVRVITERGSKKSNSVDFTLLSGDPVSFNTGGSVAGPSDQPSIQLFNRNLYCGGSFLSIFGAGFGGQQGRGFVTIRVPFLDTAGVVFHQVYAVPVAAWAENAITVSLLLPAGALPGPYTATVRRENGKSSTGEFTVGTLENGVCIVPTPRVSVSTASLEFGTQAVDSTSAAKSFLIQNTSAVPLRIINVTFNGLNQADFRFTGGDSHGVLAPGTTRVVTVEFTPKAAGPRSARADVITDAASSPNSVALSGVGG